MPITEQFLFYYCIQHVFCLKTLMMFFSLLTHSHIENTNMSRMDCGQLQSNARSARFRKKNTYSNIISG